ncbi:MAG: 3-mercaptopyruvate sulfurtransferase [Alphaproteobacteria bacterium]|nr:3-mercaptopyruvate sulfurtransferase [Alphaproteobacteria bacterium]MBU2380536.1 3-mercaptopyruvate sulfurtransferase [Alphaproteobacteria bacterium]
MNSKTNPGSEPARGDPIVSASDLLAALGDQDLRILDASWHLDGTPARPIFEAGHIPGAAFFDLEAISDHTDPLPHMMPSANQFAEQAGRLGVSETDRIVVYDTFGLFTAARAWWMFRAMGCERVQVLDGGLPAWIAAGGTLETGPAGAATTAFAARPRSGMIAGLDQVRAALEAGETVLDARGAPRFAGAVPEPRAGLRAGHMPGARNLPFAELLTPEGLMRPRAELQAAFTDRGVDPDSCPIASCGSGVTAAIPLLALAVLGHEGVLYDGSWAEWGGRSDTEVVTGP